MLATNRHLGIYFAKSTGTSDGRTTFEMRSAERPVPHEIMNVQSGLGYHGEPFGVSYRRVGGDVQVTNWTCRV